MVVYNVKIKSGKSKSALEQSLKERSLSYDILVIFIFPFCLFSRSFYKDKAIFRGEISDGGFDLVPRHKLFSTHMAMPISMKGVIRNNEIEIKYLIPSFYVLMILALVVVDIISMIVPNYIFPIGAGLIIILYLIFIIKIQSNFKRIARMT